LLFKTIISLNPKYILTKVLQNMAKFDLIMPKLGESVMEATITKWFVQEGDSVQEDVPLLEIATDKVDSEIPSPVEGKIKKILFKENDIVAVGAIIAHIELDNDDEEDLVENEETIAELLKVETLVEEKVAKTESKVSDRFYSPLVKTIAKQENIDSGELEGIIGTGSNGRLTKNDILNYIQNRKNGSKPKQQTAPIPQEKTEPVKKEVKINISIGAEDAIVEMDRMRKLIADHMVHSKHVAPHVTSMVEVDVTSIVQWRNKVKQQFEEREKEKLTYLPVFLMAMAKALKDFPGVNASVDGYNIIYRKNINLGIAVALDNGNLIVPVIKNADRLNLIGITKELNRLVKTARESKLKPDDISGGTFSVSNFGTFKNVMGTPIINQPEVAIIAIGTIEKKPAVIETPMGDTIGIRHKMFLSLTYDHRVVDGALGGAFLRKVADYIEEFDPKNSI
jgi:2-oxoglutarate dehydrogenase E2 component (dihydrolipoamide succinyltransferase)